MNTHFVLKENGKVIGEIDAYPESGEPHQDENAVLDNFSPCWMLNKDYHGKGYAYEAAYAFFDYLFGEKGARRIYAYTEDYNVPSQKLCEKLGMRREGLFKLWLKKEMKKACADTPDKPVFFMHHEHVKNTVYGSSDFDGWGNRFFTGVSDKYPNIVDFSGHSHYPVNDPRSIWQKEFTAIGTGSLKYTELTVDNERKVHPDFYDDCANFLIVEADKDSNLRVIGVDCMAEEILCEYYLKNPADKNNREYTKEKQIARSEAPAFAQGAEITVEDQSDIYVVSYPRADSTDGILLFIMGYNNLWVVGILIAIGGLPNAGMSAAKRVLLADSTDYMEWKSYKKYGVAQRNEGMVFAFSTMVSRIADLWKELLVNGGLALIGYKSAEMIDNQMVEAVQTPETLHGIFLLVVIPGIIGNLIPGIIMMFDNFTGKRKDNIMAELEIIRAEAKANLETV